MIVQKSDVMPMRSVVEMDQDGVALITLTDPASVVQTETEDGKPEYTYTTYAVRRWYGLHGMGRILESVELSFNAWLEQAKQEDRLAEEQRVRKIRDALLAESDSTMALDRLGLAVPTGTTFTAWTPFLRGIGEAMSSQWAEYRQALRDVPKQPGFPYVVQWPVKPE